MEKSFKLRFVNRAPLTMIMDKMVLEIINILSGYSKRGFEPLNKTITVIHHDYKGRRSVCYDIYDIPDELKDEVDFFRLFFTMPPYEPIHYPKTKYGEIEFSGDRIWLIKTKEVVNWESVINKNKSHLERLARICDVSCNDILCAKYHFVKGRALLEKVVTLRTLGDFLWFLNLKFQEYGKKYGISYGLIKLWKLLQQIGVKFPWRLSKEKWNEALNSTGKSIRYVPESLNYVSYCYSGRFIAADICLSGEQCEPCRAGSSLIPCLPRFGYGKYTIKRTLFPKVYPNIVLSVDIDVDKVAIPFDIIFIRGRSLNAEVTKLLINFPHNNTLVLTPSIIPYTSLRRTNGIAIVIKQDFIHALIEFMYYDRENTTCNAYISDDKKEMKEPHLLNILATKYIIYERGLYNVRVLFDRENPYKIKLNIENEVRRIVSNPFKQEFVDYVGKVLAHTLGHLLFIILSQSLEIDPEHIKYIYNSIPDKHEPGKAIYYSALVELSEFGTLRLDTQIESLLKSIGLGDIYKGLAILIRDEVYGEDKGMFNRWEMLKKLRAESCANLLEGLNDKERNVLLGIKNALLEFLKSLLNKGIVPDFTIFKYLVTQLLENKQFYEYAGIPDELLNEVSIEKIKEEKLEELLHCIGPDYCLDGCSLDIFLDKQCNEGIFENLTISRCLLDLFLKVSGIADTITVFEVPGDTIYRITSSGVHDVKIETAFISKQGIDALQRLLSKGIQVKVRIDKRQILKYEKDIKALKLMFPKTFTYEVPPENIHKKSLEVDHLRILTSWNYGTGGRSRESFYSKYKPLYD